MGAWLFDVYGRSSCWGRRITLQPQTVNRRGAAYAPFMADLTVPDVFPPDDPVAQFCVAMAMAANDVEQAIREAIGANPDGATDEDRERLRFSHKVRLTYGFLFEGIDALKGWRQGEPEV